MKNKRLIQILTITRDKVGKGYNNTGICGIFSNLYLDNIISSEEFHYLDNFLLANMPTAINQYKIFFESKLWLDPKSMNNYWWRIFDNHILGNQIRIEYLTALIENSFKPTPLERVLNYIRWKIKG